MRITTIVGARPNFIKLAPVSRAIRKKAEEVIIHTGQHYDYEMDKIFFEELGIPEPDYHLGIGSASHGRQTGEMLKGIEEILLEDRPDAVVVFGDTNSTLAGALAASKIHIPVAHIEAGVRSFNKRIPEELNRILVDHCSDLLCCPTQTAVENLKNEGIIRGVHYTGDVMVDILNECIKIAERNSRILEELDLKSKSYHLATIHRAENTDDTGRLKSIMMALCEIDNVVFPCHPRTEKVLRKIGLFGDLKRYIRIIKPVGYFSMLLLEKNARKILTDSGGMQKEAYLLKVPCVTIYETTPWVETVEDGWNIIAGAKSQTIVDMTNTFNPHGEQREIFGKGDASAKILQLVEDIIITTN